MLALSACGAVRSAEQSLRRIDILDRVFEPERFRPPPPAPILQAESLPPPAEAGPAPAPRPWIDPVTLASRPPAEPEPEAAPAPAAPPTMEPIADPPRSVDPERRRLALLRQNPWLSRFWGELTSGQQGRVSRALRRAGSSAAEEDAASWDRMGLDDRVRLVF